MGRMPEKVLPITNTNKAWFFTGIYLLNNYDHIYIISILYLIYIYIYIDVKIYIYTHIFAASLIPAKKMVM